MVAGEKWGEREETRERKREREREDERERERGREREKDISPQYFRFETLFERSEMDSGIAVSSHMCTTKWPLLENDY